jgi:hypothetical protein
VAKMKKKIKHLLKPGIYLYILGGYLAPSMNNTAKYANSIHKQTIKNKPKNDEKSTAMNPTP